MNKKRKICFVSLQAYSLFNEKCNHPHGGSEVQLYQYAVNLAKDGSLDVFFVVGDFGQLPMEVIDGVKVIKAFTLKNREFRYITGIYYQLKLLNILRKINAETYIQRAAGIETGLISLFCKLFGKKFIYMTASDIDVDGRYRKNNHFVGFVYEYGLKNASVVITQNVEHQNILKNKYKKKSLVIKNSFHIPEGAPDISLKKNILWVGSSQSLKQPEIFLKIAIGLPNEKFVMIMPKHNLNIWEKIKKEAVGISNLNFIEKIPFKEIDRYFIEAKLFASTATFEGFPNTFVQAVMHGTPIVSLNVNPDNFLRENNCGFCASGDVGIMKKKTVDILKSRITLEEMSKNAYIYAKKSHDIKENMIILKNAIEKVSG